MTDHGMRWGRKSVTNGLDRGKGIGEKMPLVI